MAVVNAFFCNGCALSTEYNRILSRAQHIEYAFAEYVFEGLESAVLIPTCVLHMHSGLKEPKRQEGSAHADKALVQQL